MSYFQRIVSIRGCVEDFLSAAAPTCRVHGHVWIRKEKIFWLQGFRAVEPSTAVMKKYFLRQPLKKSERWTGTA
jgi:hypothetical protein